MIFSPHVTIPACEDRGRHVLLHGCDCGPIRRSAGAGGRALRRIYRSVQSRHPFETIAICILPDHLHALWSLPEGDAEFPLRWSLIKSGSSRGLNVAASRSARHIAKRERGLWQRRYWEHAIRDEADLARHVDYIHFNPVKHELVPRVRDWPHSSFHQYVARGDLPEDWGGDMREIVGEFGE